MSSFSLSFTFTLWYIIMIIIIIIISSSSSNIIIPFEFFTLALADGLFL